MANEQGKGTIILRPKRTPSLTVFVGIEFPDGARHELAKTMLGGYYADRFAGSLAAMLAGVEGWEHVSLTEEEAATVQQVASEAGYTVTILPLVAEGW